MGNTASCLTFSSYGKVGISIGVGQPVATITAPGTAGRYKIWGMGRHTFDDGLRLKVAGFTLVLSGPGLTQMVIDPPLVMQLTGTDDIIVETNVATGLTGLGSFTLFAQRQCEHLSEHAC